MGAGLTAFIILAVKAHLGRKIGRKLEENEDRIIAKGKSTILNTPEDK